MTSSPTRKHLPGLTDYTWFVWWCEHKQAPTERNCRTPAGRREGVTSFTEEHTNCRWLAQDPLGRFIELSGKEHKPRGG